VSDALALSLTLGLAATAPASLRTYPAPEASQGVAVDARHVYAIGNSEIAKYDRATGRRIAGWSGDPAKFPHLNSCALVRRELVCAASNYPEVPMESRIEVFDPQRMQHLRTVDLGRQQGSLTWAAWRDGAWWAGFANYDNRGREAPRDHRDTKVVKFDARWKPLATWTLPPNVLERMKPYSTSGGVFGPGGLLFVTGHDRPEAYVLRIPKSGAVLEHVRTLPVAMEGQAIGIDEGRGLLFGIRRGVREIVVSSVATADPSSPDR